MRRMPSIPQSRGTGGKAWGNALGGYKTQRRDVTGKFATSAQSYKAKREASREYKADRIKPRTKAQKKAGRITATQVKVASAAGTTAAVLAVGPSISFGRKHIGLSISPDFNLGKNYKVSSHHSIALDRVTDDLIDKRRKRTQAKASRVAHRVLGNGVASDIADNAIGTKQEFTIRGTTFKTDKPAPARRWRSMAATTPPGAPALGPKRKPKQGKKGAKTITNKTKGKSGVALGAKSGNGRKQRRKKKSPQLR